MQQIRGACSLCCTLFNSTHYCTVTHHCFPCLTSHVSPEDEPSNSLLFHERCASSRFAGTSERDATKIFARLVALLTFRMHKERPKTRARGISLVTSVTPQCEKYAQSLANPAFFFLFVFVHKFLEHFGEQSHARNRILKRHEIIFTRDTN